jgi:AcrR family transcriptional regulator
VSEARVASRAETNLIRVKPPSALPPPAEDGWDRRRRRVSSGIEESAIALFAQRGYPNVTMAQVAERAGVSSRTVTRHFPLKEDLLLSAPRRRRVYTLAAMSRLDASTDPLADMFAIFADLAAVHADELDYFRLWTKAVLSVPEMRGSAQGDLLLETVDELVPHVARALGVDPNDDVRPRVLSSALISAVDGAVQYWFNRGGVDDWRSLLDDVLHALRTGFDPLMAKRP